MKTWKKRLPILFIVCMMVSALPTNVQAASKSKIQISKKKLTLNVGKTATLKLKGTKKTPKWTSSKKSVATVTKKGKVKAKKKGSTVITAKLGKKKYNCKVTVKSTAASNTTSTASTNTTSTASTNTTSTAPTNTTPPAASNTTPSAPTNTTPPSVPNTGMQTVAGNYQKLLNYLLYYGTYSYESEDYYISDQIKTASATLFTTIEYNLDGSFDFTAMLMSDDGTDNMISINITPPEFAKGKVRNILEFSSGDLLYANGEVVLSSLTTTNQHITYTTTNAETESIRDSLYVLGESMLKLGLQSWSLMLEESNLGLSLKDFGFTSYEG